jgi:hypothetical protein
MLAEARADRVPLGSAQLVAPALAERVLRLLRPVCAAHLLTCSHAIQLQVCLEIQGHTVTGIQGVV